MLLISAFVLPSLALAYGAWGRKDSRCKSLFFASLGMVVVMVLTVLLMDLGVRVNASGFFSFATTFFVGFIIYTESRWHLFGLLSHIPGTEEHQVKKALSQQIALKDAENLVLRLIIHRELQRTKNNVSEAARNLGATRQMLYRRYPELKNRKNPTAK